MYVLIINLISAILNNIVIINNIVNLSIGVQFLNFKDSDILVEILINI